MDRLAGCASGTPRAERYVPPAMGASWSYRITSTGSFGSGSADVPMRVSQTEWQGRRLLRFENPSGATLQDDRVGVVAVLDRNGRAVMSYEPALTYRWPLEVGRSWTEELVLRVTSGSGAVVGARHDGRVRAPPERAWSESSAGGCRHPAHGVAERACRALIRPRGRCVVPTPPRWWSCAPRRWRRSRRARRRAAPAIRRAAGPDSRTRRSPSTAGAAPASPTGAT